MKRRTKTNKASLQGMATGRWPLFFQKIQMKKFSFSLVSALMLSAAIAHGAPPTPISAPQHITVPGHYILVTDIVEPTAAAPDPAIEIFASDVTLDLNGHTIFAAPNSVAVFIVQLANNVQVTNGKIVTGGTNLTGIVLGILIGGSNCLVTGLDITVGIGGTGVSIGFSGSGPTQFNRVTNCITERAP